MSDGSEQGLTASCDFWVGVIAGLRATDNLILSEIQKFCRFGYSIEKVSDVMKAQAKLAILQLGELWISYCINTTCWDVVSGTGPTFRSSDVPLSEPAN